MLGETRQEPVDGARPGRRICSGGCPFFQPEYRSGRKVAGVGTCGRRLCGTSVQVGMACLWLRAGPRRAA